VFRRIPVHRGHPGIPAGDGGNVHGDRIGGEIRKPKEARRQAKYWPPLMLTISPVIQPEPSEQSHKAADATSGG